MSLVVTKRKMDTDGHMQVVNTLEGPTQLNSSYAGDHKAVDFIWFMIDVLAMQLNTLGKSKFTITIKGPGSYKVKRDFKAKDLLAWYAGGTGAPYQNEMVGEELTNNQTGAANYVLFEMTPVDLAVPTTSPALASGQYKIELEVDGHHENVSCGVSVGQSGAVIWNIQGNGHFEENIVATKA